MTNEAPERIKIDEDYWFVPDALPHDPSETEYVRADLYDTLKAERDRLRGALTEIYEYPSGQPIALGLDEVDWQKRRAEQMRFIARVALEGGE